ncbi:hypothetical protein VJ923_08265 [Adlercreutzia sp. R25]|uniref:hypothetical protein n=1 Tax=Adlercreutzia shanghongiae TaxID=3111773 RepID=UPI002DB90704|nr:hypothetical protein [Adlercreutzia sp. R25]MEC4273150.1 hypothetical protein [Adlercreutzia sp. R25]
MQELAFNAPTVVILLVILGLAALAIRRMTRRGLCDCGDHCGDGERGCAGCSHCAAAAHDGAEPSQDGQGDPPCCQAAQRMTRAALAAAHNGS